MNVGMGKEAEKFHFWEYVNRIFSTVYADLVYMRRQNLYQNKRRKLN
jgi:hypothetical protein